MLTARERLDFCKKCENRSSDLKLGIVCSLTNAKPDFVESCGDFKPDQAEVQKDIARQQLEREANEAVKMPVWQIILGAIVTLIALVRLITAFS